MTTTAKDSAAAPSHGADLSPAWRRGGAHARPLSWAKGDWLVLALGAGVTLCIELGVYLAACRGGAGQREATLATLAAAAAWVALASGPLAAGAQSVLGVLIRAAGPADASLAALALLAVAAHPQHDGREILDALAVSQIYCILASMAVFSMALTAVASAGRGKAVVAVAAAALLMLLLATPFWCGGMLVGAPPAWSGPLADAMVDLNPFYGITATLVHRAGFIWHAWGLMYEKVSSFGTIPPPPLRWHTSAVALLIASVPLGAVAFFRRRRA